MKTAIPTAAALFRRAARTLQRYPLIGVCTAALLLAGGLTILFLFRYTPSHPLWEHFRVLAVPADGTEGTSEGTVLSLLKNAGIDSVISRSGRFPFPYPREAPVQPDSDGYYRESLSFFSDQEGRYSLFFLPEAKGLEKQAAAAFDGTGISAVLDGGFVWNPLPAFFLIPLGGIFFFFSKQKGFFLSAALPFLFFSLCSPLFSVCAGSCFVLSFLFWTEKFWKRAASAASLLREPLLFLFLSAALVFFIIPGVTSGDGYIGDGSIALLSICCFAASGAAVFLLYTGERKLRRRERHVFSPVPIMPVSILTSNSKTFLITVIPLWSCLIATAFFFIFSHGFVSFAAADGLSIPAPTGYTENVGFNVRELAALEAVRPEQRLPDLADFLRFQWDIQTFPYRSVHSGGMNAPGKNAVEIIRYEADENGKILVRTEQVKLFNDQFITDIIEQEKHGKLTLESMLISQGRFAAIGYGGLNSGGGVCSSVESNSPFIFYIILILVLPGAAILIYKGSTHDRAI